MDWLLARKDPIERRLARRHLEEGTLVLYNLIEVDGVTVDPVCAVMPQSTDLARRLAHRVDNVDHRFRCYTFGQLRLTKRDRPIPSIRSGPLLHF